LVSGGTTKAAISPSPANQDSSSALAVELSPASWSMAGNHVTSV
jgi:hypothetical protein